MHFVFTSGKAWFVSNDVGKPSAISSLLDCLSYPCGRDPIQLCFTSGIFKRRRQGSAVTVSIGYNPDFISSKFPDMEQSPHHSQERGVAQKRITAQGIPMKSSAHAWLPSLDGGAAPSPSPSSLLCHSRQAPTRLAIPVASGRIISSHPGSLFPFCLLFIYPCAPWECNVYSLAHWEANN